MQEFYDQHHEGFVLGNDNPTFKTQAGDKPYIGDFLATRLINQDGVIQIGNDVFTFQMEGKRLKTLDKVFDRTSKDKILPVSDVSDYNVKVMGGDIPKSAGARVPDQPLVGTYIDYGPGRRALAYFSQSGIWPFYTSFALKYKMEEYSGWWIFKSWGSINASHLDIQYGHLRLRGSEGTTVLDTYNISDDCNGCSEARGYAGSVNFSFGGSIEQVQGRFHATYNGDSQERNLY